MSAPQLFTAFLFRRFVVIFIQNTDCLSRHYLVASTRGIQICLLTYQPAYLWETQHQQQTEMRIKCRRREIRIQGWFVSLVVSHAPFRMISNDFETFESSSAELLQPTRHVLEAYSPRNCLTQAMHQLHLGSMSVLTC